MTTRIPYDWREGSLKGLLVRRCALCRSLSDRSQTTCTSCGAHEWLVHDRTEQWVIEAILESHQPLGTTVLDSEVPRVFVVGSLEGYRLIGLLVNPKDTVVGNHVVLTTIRLRGETLDEPLRYVLAFRAIDQ